MHLFGPGEEGATANAASRDKGAQYSESQGAQGEEGQAQTDQAEETNAERSLAQSMKEWSERLNMVSAK